MSNEKGQMDKIIHRKTEKNHFKVAKLLWVNLGIETFGKLTECEDNIWS